MRLPGAQVRLLPHHAVPLDHGVHRAIIVDEPAPREEAGGDVPSVLDADLVGEDELRRARRSTAPVTMKDAP